MAKIVCISDTHSRHRNIEIESCDILIHSGDGTNMGREHEVKDLVDWFCEQDANHIIYVPGNHDIGLEKNWEEYGQWFKDFGINLLRDESVNVEGVSVIDFEEYEIKIYGSPMTPNFGNWAFMDERGTAINKYWSMIDSDTDILVTHGPPYGVLDQVGSFFGSKEHVGCEMLLPAVERVKPKYHVFGHIHEGHGQLELKDTTFINAAQCNEYNTLIHKPIVIDYK